MKSTAVVSFNPDDGISVVLGENGSDDWQKVGDSISREYLFNSGTASFIDSDDYLSLDGVTEIAEAVYSELG